MERRYNELPPQWNGTPHALVGLVGANEFHASMRTALEHQSGLKVTSQQMRKLPSLKILSLDEQFNIPAKATRPTAGIKKFNLPVKGLLKSNWMQKWHSVIPGLILLLVDMRKGSLRWEATELAICNQLEKLRNKTLERKVNVAVILLLQSTADAPRDEQLFSLKKHGQLDNRQLYKITRRELANPDSAMVAKTWKNAQEMLINFYSTAIRKYTKHLNAKSVKSCAPLQARHTFKIAYFWEVLGEKFKALQKYETAMRIATRITEKQNFNDEQVKVFAAACMWRIYTYTLRDKNSVDAHRSKYFRNFLLHFRKRIGSCKYRHYGWLAQQCLMFARQLDRFEAKATSTKEKPVHFRNLSVQYAVLQREAAQQADLYRSGIMATNAKDYAKFKIQPPAFIGGEPVVLDSKSGDIIPVSTDESSGPVLGGTFSILEQLVDHSTNIKAVLSECIAYDMRLFQAKVRNFLIIFQFISCH